MNRIYQGQVTRVDVTTRDADNPWRPEDSWQKMLWQHHVLFQDAVNYYTLCLASLAGTVDRSAAEGRALASWRSQVEGSWREGVRRAIRFEGPHRRICEVLGLKPEISGFDECVRAVLKKAKATKERMGEALMQLLREADKSDLNQLCVGRLPWFCSPEGKFDGTSKSVAVGQEIRMLTLIRSVHQATAPELSRLQFDAGAFLTQPPSEFLEGTEAQAEILRVVEKLAKSDDKVASLKKDLAAYLEKRGDGLKIPSPGRRPKGIYPYALLFSVWPCPATAEIFKEETKTIKDRPDPRAEVDAIAEARVADTPLFEYFTNVAFYRNSDEKNRAVWFEFDLAAFIEAIKSPHRYFQDTLAREAAAEVIRGRIAKMEGKGGSGESADDEDYFGFEGDSRVERLREIVTDELGFEAEDESSNGKIEYSITERTLRGWKEIRRRWREELRKGTPDTERLLEILKAEQTEHRDDFGSATLFRKLLEPKNHCIWKEGGREAYHAEDPLAAWKVYKETVAELADTERPIRFTPAHPDHSPRYFIFPHKAKAGGRFGSVHERNELAFQSGLVVKTERGWEPMPVRITYSAPRLKRDEIFEKDTEAGRWLQPMMKALGLAETDAVDLSSTRIVLNVYHREREVNCQLSFPVAIEPENLQRRVGKKMLWERQFNMRPDGDDFREASLRWPHEKPAKTPAGWQPWHAQVTEFRVLSVDLGQRDAGAYALLEARTRGRKTDKPSRYIGTAGEKKWRAELVNTGLLRLPGEDASVWRDASALERQRGMGGYAFRQELWGDRGRPALPGESKQASDLIDKLGQEPTSFFDGGNPANFSFPEQNDELLRAARRAQSWTAKLHRWAWMLSDDKFSTKREDVIEEMRALEGGTESIQRIREAAEEGKFKRLNPLITKELTHFLSVLPQGLVEIANRIVPLRGRTWNWNKHPQAKNCFLLDQTGEAREKAQIRGQRGLSFQRIEQIEELRRRFQSLNQQLRRAIGGAAPKQRDESIPDPCPDLLEKLDRLKRQRVHQTAHMILAEALGLRLSAPPGDKREQWRDADVHGVYEKKREIADFIVIEDLSRYRASQGRAPRENSRLMKWCHRSVRDKLREIAEPFGIPVLETAAAYSSRFCSRSGVAGFRAVEVNESSFNDPSWKRILEAWAEHQKPNGKKLSPERAEEYRNVSELFEQLRNLGTAASGAPRTLLAPRSLGPLFVPLVSSAEEVDIQPAVGQADINAAINLGLRAIADPRLWSIHPRLRTEWVGKGGTLMAREKRKFGDRKAPEVSFPGAVASELSESKNPNFFVDLSNQVKWGTAGVVDPMSGKAQRVCWSKAFWGEVKRAQWARVREINEQRIAAWTKRAEAEDRLPM